MKKMSMTEKQMAQMHKQMSKPMPMPKGKGKH